MVALNESTLERLIALLADADTATSRLLLEEIKHTARTVKEPEE